MGFNIRDLSSQQVSSMIENDIWNEDCPVHHSRLKVLELNYFNFNDEIHSGKMMVLEEVSNQVISIFKELYKLQFPIARMVLIDEFEGDDVRSMEANNTSAFNGRKVMGTNRWSSHAFGAAIDVNTIQNPYVRIREEDATAKIYPSSGIKYLNRNLQEKGMVEDIVSIFAGHGFTNWGGNWANPLDYHHFQLPWSKIKQLFPDADIELKE